MRRDEDRGGGRRSVAVPPDARLQVACQNHGAAPRPTSYRHQNHRNDRPAAPRPTPTAPRAAPAAPRPTSAILLPTPAGLDRRQQRHRDQHDDNQQPF
eukprot:8881324-Pyramimonas_sp.AAC.1